MSRTLLMALISLGASLGATLAQVAQDFAVDLKALPSTSAPHLTLTWAQRQQAAVTAQRVHRRAKGATTWTLQTTLGTGDTSWPDPTAALGVEYEYWLERTYTGLFPSRPLGFLAAGAHVPPIEERGTLLLVVDNTMTTPLAREIAELVDDLAADGWHVQTLPVARTATPPSVKAQIQAAVTADPNVRSAYLLGRVPVPYSGNLAPDGHGDHSGAWPADGYYGDLNGLWTDLTVNNTSASRAQNDNIPGDGKFDQSSLPSDLELEVGRVDLSQMTQAPTASVSETSLLRRYLRKAHDYRYRLGAYASVPRRSMIRDGFGYFGGESFASSGWAAAFSTVGSQVDQPASNGWFTQATSNTYLFGYGNGGGNYTSASTVGNTTDFGRRPSRVVFTMLFGSYFGDWDSTNNFLRAPLAGNATGDSLGLTCYWSGRPYGYLHPAGLGETVGYAARLSMNNSGSNYTPSNFPTRGVHLGLMGDPALRLHLVEPPRNCAATTAVGGVTLRWDASSETNLLGYHVYRALAPGSAFTRLTAAPLETPGFTDATGTVGQSYRYLVRTLKLETVPGGSYQNLSQGALVTIAVSSAATGAPFSPGSLTAQVLTSQQLVLTWVDNASDETQFRIERLLSNGTWFQIATVGANVTTFTDPSLTAPGEVLAYRVRASNAAGISPPSNEASAQTSAGFLEASVPRLKVPRSTGVAAVPVVRFGATNNATSVVVTTSDVSALAGTHYTNSSGSLSFADGVNGTQTLNVPLSTGGAPRLPRQFNLLLSDPTNEAELTAQTITRVLIEDPAATLPAPWAQTILGAVTDSSPAVFAEGAIGSSVAGGSASTADNGRFVHQTRIGDGVLTAFIDSPLPAQSSARFGVMIRGSTASDVAMASAQIATSTVGANLVIRPSTGGNLTLLPGTSSTLVAPRWVRLTRGGDTFTAETSADGGAWTVLGATSITSPAPIPATALWGLYHHGDTSGNFQLARFRFVTLTDPGVLSAPVNFTASPQPPSQIALAWDPVGGATAYELERRARHGTFALLQTFPAGTASFTDTGLPGVQYEYRLRATHGPTLSTTVVRSATAPGTPTPYRQWLSANGLPMDGSGLGAPGVSIPGDGIPNTMKFALGLSPQTVGYSGRLTTGTVETGGQFFNSLTYLRPEPPPVGNLYSVETGSTLADWSPTDTLEIANSVAGGFRTLTVRDTLPASPANPRRFLRLKVVVP